MDTIQRKYGLYCRPLLLLQGGVLPEFEASNDRKRHTTINLLCGIGNGLVDE